MKNKHITSFNPQKESSKRVIQNNLPMEMDASIQEAIDSNEGNCVIIQSNDSTLYILI